MAHSRLTKQDVAQAIKAFKSAGGVKAEAARRLKIPVNTLKSSWTRRCAGSAWQDRSHRAREARGARHAGAFAKDRADRTTS